MALSCRNTDRYEERGSRLSSKHLAALGELIACGTDKNYADRLTLQSSSLLKSLSPLENLSQLDGWRIRVNIDLPAAPPKLPLLRHAYDWSTLNNLGCAIRAQKDWYQDRIRMASKRAVDFVANSMRETCSSIKGGSLWVAIQVRTPNTTEEVELTLWEWTLTEAGRGGTKVMVADEGIPWSCLSFKPSSKHVLLF